MRKRYTLLSLVVSIVVLSSAIGVFAKKIEDDESRRFWGITETWIDEEQMHTWGYGSEGGMGHSLAEDDYFDVYLDWSPTQGVCFKIGLFDWISQDIVEGTFFYPSKAAYNIITAPEDGTYCICIDNDWGGGSVTYGGYYYIYGK